MAEQNHVICAHCGAINNVPVARLGDDPKCGKCAKPVFSGKPLELNEAGFERFINKSHQPVVVDFWAPWCGPCKMMAPTFSQAAAQLEPRFRLVKVNTEAHQNLAMRLRIQSIPTLAIYKGGREVIRQAGAMGLADLLNWVRSNGG